MMVNPYNPVSASDDDSNASGDHGLVIRRLIHRPAFVVVWILIWLLLGGGFILLMHIFAV